MEELGAKPIPTYHTGEPLELLQRYVEKYDYIALGGNVGRSTDELIGWLDEMWHRYLTNSNGLPLIRVHGFGVTSPEVMLRYPWYSVDSTSWLMAAATGKAIICRRNPYSGEPEFESIWVSDKAPDASVGQHFDSLRPSERIAWSGHIDMRGFDIEGLSKDYRQRFFFNALAYTTFAKLTRPYRSFQPTMTNLFEVPRSSKTHRKAAEPWSQLTMFLAGNPGAANITNGLMKKGYNRLLSYHYIAESMSHFNEAREVLDSWPNT